MNIVSNSNFCLRKRHLIELITRHFSKSNCSNDKNASREARAFNKLIGATTQKKKRIYINSDSGSRASLQTLTVLGGKNKTCKENSRRIHVLNKLFMRNITDLMVTGPHSADLFGHGLQISRVAVAPDFNKVNVYWLANENENDTNLEKLLFDISHDLRHQLSQLRVMGVVPRIEFIKDKHYARVIKVDSLLNKLDFSEDVEVPTHPIDCPKEESTAAIVELHMETEEKDEHEEFTSLNKDNQRSNKVLMFEQPNQTEDEPPLPPMEHNVFNLDHESIMNRIKMGVIKSKALHRKDPNIAPPPSTELLSTAVSDEMSEKERREQFAKFLLQRKILREKALKKERKYGPDVRLPTQQLELEFPYEFAKYKEPYDSEQDYDYIDEEEPMDECSNR